jgi:hypothetical protein
MPGAGQGCKMRPLFRWELGVAKIAGSGPVALFEAPSVSSDAAGCKASLVLHRLEPGDHRLNLLIALVRPNA